MRIALYNMCVYYIMSSKLPEPSDKSDKKYTIVRNVENADQTAMREKRDKKISQEQTKAEPDPITVDEPNRPSSRGGKNSRRKTRKTRKTRKSGKRTGKRRK